MPLTIPADDFGMIRVFATTLPLPQEVLMKTPDGMLALFGAPLNPAYVDIVPIADLGGMALTRYIHEGYDLAPDLVDAASLDRIMGTVVLVLSRATGGTPTKLQPGFGLRHVTTYAPTPDLALHEALPAGGAEGDLPPPDAAPAKSNARLSGMVALAALVAMFLLVGLMILIGG